MKSQMKEGRKKRGTSHTDRQTDSKRYTRKRADRDIEVRKTQRQT